MDNISILNSVFALIFVLALIGGVSALLRKYGHNTRVTGVRKGKRLSVTDMEVVDSKRRLVLIKRDDVEHLMILSPDGDTLIESGIKKGTKK